MKTSNMYSTADLRAIALEAMIKNGYTLTRQPGYRQLYDVKPSTDFHGSPFTVLLKVGRDTTIGMRLTDDGWESLDQADKVLVAVPNDKYDPDQVQVYLIDADYVRDRFNMCLAAREKSGENITPKAMQAGMWVYVLEPHLDGPRSVGGNWAKEHDAIKVYSGPYRAELDVTENPGIGQEPEIEDDSPIDSVAIRLGAVENRLAAIEARLAAL